MKLLIGMAVLALGMGLAGESAADDGPQPFPDFTFKRVKPPEPGATRRITVQITEPAFAPRPAAPAPGPVAPPGAPEAEGPVAWYWSQVAPELAAANAGRLEDALRALGSAPPGQAVIPPRLDTLRAIADRHGIDILTATVGTRVSPALVLAVISVESSGRPTAISSAGAQGLMQLMPATAARFSVTDAFAPNENIRGGVAYLDFLLGEFGLDPVLALAAYNAGEGSVMTHGGVPPFAETRAYVPKVLAAWQVARGLCVTPPALITDGCVFVRGRG